MTPAGGRRTGAGRKPYESPSQIRKARSIRFSDPEWAQLNQQAKENGYQNISDYLRSLAKLNNLENKLENNKEETKMLNQRTMEIIEETGKIATSTIEDIAAFQAELKTAGYISYMDPSTDYLIAEKEVNTSIRAIFDNGGGLTLQLGDWAHWYSDNMSQAAEDYLTFAEERNTDGWDGHEESEAELEPTNEQIANGGYRVYWEEDLEHLINDKDLNSWGNINDFCREVRKIRSEQKQK